jgi:hypothetical protein
VKRLLVIVIVFIAVAGVALRFWGSHTPPQQRASKVLILKTEHKLFLLDDGNKVMHRYPDHKVIPPT